MLRQRTHSILRPMRLFLCVSAAALILGAAPGGNFAFVAPAHAQADVVFTASVAPPALPVYSQPPIPGLGYIWIPGHWAWDGQEYYWVPGFWELPPAADLLWTPGYWAWNDTDDDYVYYSGYWAPTVGFYGGIDYGFGYTGEGYYGGYWRDHHFYYNQAVNNLGTAHIATVFNRPIPAPAAPTRVSFNGGHGGATLRPTPAQLAILRGPHQPPTAAQIQHRQAASRIASLKFGANHGQPPIPAVQRANEFTGAHVPAAAAAAGAAGVAGAALAAHAAGFHRPPGIAHAAPHFAHAAPHNAMRAPAFHPHVAFQHPNFAYHAPTMHAPAVHPNFAYHAPTFQAPAFHQNFAYHAPTFQAPAFHAPTVGSTGGMHFGGAPHFGGGAFAGGAPHFSGGGVHFGGAPGGGPRRP